VLLIDGRLPTCDTVQLRSLSNDQNKLVVALRGGLGLHTPGDRTHGITAREFHTEVPA
jgi:hypothetical protein